MSIEQLYEFCRSLPYSEECMPFDDETLVFKVFGKMFILIDLQYPVFINIKLSAERSIQLREEYEEIKPGYHMNKKYWNTVSITERLTDEFIKSLIRESYQNVVALLPKKYKQLCTKN